MPVLIILDFGLTSFAQLMPEKYRHKDPVPPIEIITFEKNRKYYVGLKGLHLLGYSKNV
jgi:hypothetical protein